MANNINLKPSSSSSLSSPLSKSLSNTRLHLTKACRRTWRTICTETRLFLLRPFHRRKCAVFFLLLLASILVLFLQLRFLLPIIAPVLSFYGPRSETHFSRPNHIIIPRPATFEHIRTRPCSWLYLEFGAKDGRHLDGFFTNGNKFLEEYLRATQSASRAFCALAFEPDPDLLPSLQAVRAKRARRAGTFDVFTKFVPGARDATEILKFRSEDTGNIPEEEIPAMSIGLRQFLYNVTFPLEQSGNDIAKMVTARGNGNTGTVIVRFNDLSVPQALWYLDLMEAGSDTGVLCTRVDRLILDFERIRLDVDSLKGHVQHREVVRDWARVTTSPTDRMFKPSDDMDVILKLAREINTMPHCRALVHVLDDAGKMILPEPLNERQVFYGILAGEPTFNERISAQTATWMTAVPKDRLTIFTNAERNQQDMAAAREHDVAVVRPYRPEIESHLSLMQSWSHLVRTREAWDRSMRDNPEIKWLALVDDDTFVFPGGLRQYLSSFDHRILLWGGSGEQARIDNGDTGQFAFWLRRIHLKYGGKHCYMKNENIPRHLQGTHYEYVTSDVMNGRRIAKKVSHMCEDTFCLRGCPAVPQGAAIVLSRTLVEALRPHIEKCERDTSMLCRNCGSQRLFMCVNRYTRKPRTILTRGICRSPWKLEHREHWPFALTYHGFNRYHGMTRSTHSLAEDMRELWALGRAQEDAVRRGFEASYFVPIQRVADQIACRMKGTYQGGLCHTPDGKVFQANDGKSRGRQRRQPPVPQQKDRPRPVRAPAPVEADGNMRHQ